MTPQDWELLSLFEKDDYECVNFNAIGALCGCPNNEPHPEACGPLCPDGADTLHSGLHHVWGNTCKDWGTMSTFYPIWYNNDEDESCDEYFRDVRHGCACPGIPEPSLECGALCQERRTCKPICQNGASVPDPDALVQRDTCRGWELHSRLEVHEQICPYYDMIGAQCGCENTPSPDACGPLCGAEGGFPDPKREVLGESCESWYVFSFALSGIPAIVHARPVHRYFHSHVPGITNQPSSPMTTEKTVMGTGPSCNLAPIIFLEQLSDVGVLVLSHLKTDAENYAPMAQLSPTHL